MTRLPFEKASTDLPGIRRNLAAAGVCLALLLGSAAFLWAAEAPAGNVCKVLVDKRLEGPAGTIIKEYGRRMGWQFSLRCLPVAEVNSLVEKNKTDCDVVISMPAGAKSKSPLGSLAGAKKVAWKHPTGEPVWAAPVTKHPHATGLVSFLGGPTGHRLWAESKTGFRIATGKTTAEAYAWVVEHRTKHTYPMTAMRMVAELGGIRDGICIDVGCGSGMLDVELAKRSNFKIIGLDIDPNVKPLFEKEIRKAGLEKRISFVLGDAQKMPFPDNYADAIISRGTLTFIPDKKKCLREVHRVLKPTGVAFLGGRYVYTPQKYKTPTAELRKIVAESGVPGAKVIDARGQWVKIVAAKAPKAAHTFQGGPHMLANRFIADYAITKGKGLLICKSDGGLEQGLQRGLVTMTELQLTALYPSQKVADQAAKRIRATKHADRITCKVGGIGKLPFEDGSFDLVAGVGPVLIWQKDKAKAMSEIHRVLREGGAALVGGRYLYMPKVRRVSSDALRKSAARTGISSIRVYDNMGQWVEIRKGVKDRGFRD